MSRDVMEGAHAGRAEESTGDLVKHLAEEVSDVVHKELHLAQVEMSSKAKKAGAGAGLFGAAGIIALFGLGALVAAAIIALALAVDAWLAAVIVGGALLVVSGVLALVGKRELGEATPPMPTETVDNVKRDLSAVKGVGS